MQTVCRLAVQAGAKVMQVYKGEFSATQKKDASPLTVADLASHNFLSEQLPVLMPGVPVISEESADAGHDIPSEGRYWLVDPLDGTKEFVKRTSEFTVNIALMEEGRPRLGVVHAPALNLTYYAAAGLGAWRHLEGQKAEPIQTRSAPTCAPVVVASKDHAGPLVAAMLSQLREPTLRSMGSSLKFCLVAEGTADIYLRDLPTMEWDTAAAQCVVETAGGKVCSLDGQPLGYGKPGLKNSVIMTIGDAKLDWMALISDHNVKGTRI